MFRFVSIGVDTLTAAVVLIPVLLILFYFVFRKVPIRKKGALIILGLYFSAVISAVGLPSIYSMTIDLSVNLIPFIDILSSPIEYLKNSLLNIILFIPLGFLLPYIWKHFRFFKNTLFFGFGCTLFIEVMQIFTFRLTDVDDLITNVTGTILGYLAVMFFLKRGHSVTLLHKESSDYKFELSMVLASVLIIMFFIQPFIADAVWARLLI